MVESFIQDLRRLASPILALQPRQTSVPCAPILNIDRVGFITNSTDTSVEKTAASGGEHFPKFDVQLVKSINMFFYQTAALGCRAEGGSERTSSVTRLSLLHIASTQSRCSGFMSTERRHVMGP